MLFYFEYTPPTAAYAGFWRRFVAAFVDLVLYSILCSLIGLVIPDNGLWGEVMYAFVAVVGYCFFLAARVQATPGMRLMRVYIETVEGEQLSHLHAAIWGFVGWLGLFLCLGAAIFVDAHYNLEALTALNSRIMAGEIIDINDPQLTQALGMPYLDMIKIIGGSVALCLLLLLSWALSVGLSQDKTGFHNRLCHTRMLVGRK